MSNAAKDSPTGTVAKATPRQAVSARRKVLSAVLSSQALLAAVAVAVVALPWVVPVHYTLLTLPFFAYSLAALGVNLLFGYTGLLSFGQALFVAIGAYTTAFATSQLGIRSMELILLMAVGASACVAALIGVLCVRYVKIYFAMLTLAFGMLLYTFLLKASSLTGGDQGMRSLLPSLLGARPAGDYLTFLIGPFYYYSAALLAVLGYLMWRIVKSPFGLFLRAIRENPTKAEYLGIRVRLYRWLAFVIASVWASVAGVLLVPINLLAVPSIAHWTSSGNLVFMTLLGGFGNFFGPVLGALVFVYLQDWVQSLVPYWRLVFGSMLILIILFAPRGLTGLIPTRRR